MVRPTGNWSLRSIPSERKIIGKVVFLFFFIFIIWGLMFIGFPEKINGVAYDAIIYNESDSEFLENAIIIVEGTVYKRLFNGDCFKGKIKIFKSEKFPKGNINNLDFEIIENNKIFHQRVNDSYYIDGNIYLSNSIDKIIVSSDTGFVLAAPASTRVEATEIISELLK